MNTGELAYLTGVLDTRAVVRTRLAPDSGTVLPTIALSCGDAELLRWLAQITGVRAISTSRSYDKHRCLEHCDRAHEHIRSVSGRWSLTGTRATVVLLCTRPWVRFSAERWDRAITAGLEAPRKDAVLHKMDTLGWPLPLPWPTQ